MVSRYSLCICSDLLRPFKRGGKCVTNLSRHNSQECLFMQHILRVFLVSAWSKGPILVLICIKKQIQKTNYSKRSHLVRGRSQTTFTRFGFFWLPIPLRLRFLWYKFLQIVHFFGHLPPPLVNVVCERPLRLKEISKI